MALTVKATVDIPNCRILVRNKTNTVWNEIPLYSTNTEVFDKIKDGESAFFRAHLEQDADYPQGKKIVLDEELEAEKW